jgi:hypothetical protein
LPVDLSSINHGTSRDLPPKGTPVERGEGDGDPAGRDEQGVVRPRLPGRGITLRDSRRALLMGDDDGDQIASGERECLDCLGDGRAEGSGR